ncbi:TetR/AcrR family transcriptional regulator [Nocardioides bruguierae]|uniref:TetR/AcrR family transcriptional regulator n=1 Tax=Nocardioides bruguierae TaxID=2945102 RepID=UPI0020200C22|nr:TetR/AcrR family transcriptional regulator [Nocardioides bruguierae]MCL8027165.1 TetR/AcrR family transcriptional regulator [Nocardioides bruguierae]
MTDPTDDLTPLQRARRARVDEAALALLRGGGPSAVTMEAVAATSGVAKTTLYRRYRDRGDLLAATLGRAVRVWEPTPTGDVRAGLLAVLAETRRQMHDVLGPGGLAALVADEDPAFTAAVRAVLVPWAQALSDLVAAHARAGTVRPDVDPDAVVTLLLGAYVGHLLWHRDVPEGALDPAADLMWAALTGRPATQPLG